MMSFDHIKQLKAAIKYNKLVNFPGENVTNCCLKTRYYCKRIDSSWYWDEQLLVKLAKIFKVFTEEKCRIWALTNSPKKIKYIEKRTFQNMIFIPQEHRIDHDNMLKGGTAEYQMILNNKEWNTALNSKTNKEDETIPYGYQAHIDSLV